MMRQLRFFLLIIFSLTLASFSLAPVHAAPASATLGVSSSLGTVETDQSFTLTFALTSATEAISAVSIKIAVPAGTTLVSSSTASTVFATEVTAPNITSGIFTWERLRSDTGYTGVSGFIGTATFRVSQAGTATFQIDKATSQVIAYSDSTNVLATVSSASVTVNQGNGTLPQTGSQPAIAIIGLLTTGCVLAFSLWRNRTLIAG